MEVVFPSVEGDQLVGAGDFSVPLADIFRLEVQEIDILKTLEFGPYALAGVVALIWCLADTGLCLDSTPW